MGAFVSLSVAIFVYQGLRHRAIYLGFSNLLVYAGAVAVLFVFVVLLIESQHARVGASDVTLTDTGLGATGAILASLVWGMNFATQPVALATAKLEAGPGLLAALSSLVYGEHLGVLLLTAGALLVSTVISVTVSLV